VSKERIVVFVGKRRGAAHKTRRRKEEKTMADLMRYKDASYIREATEDELAESIAAAEVDGGAGAITVEIDGEDVTCYVVE
jgi:hypothetical protein